MFTGSCGLREHLICGIEDRSRISRTVDDMHDDQLGRIEGVVDGIAFVELNAQTGCKFFAAGSDFRVVQKRRETLRDLSDECGGALRGVFCDIGPDIGQIVFGGFSDPEF